MGRAVWECAVCVCESMLSMREYAVCVCVCCVCQCVCASWTQIMPKLIDMHMNIG